MFEPGLPLKKNQCFTFFTAAPKGVVVNFAKNRTKYHRVFREERGWRKAEAIYINKLWLIQWCLQRQAETKFLIYASLYPFLLSGNRDHGFIMSLWSLGS